ncbi:MAG: hypothetical protein WAN36_08455 [Calditrichia bacterium]
MKLRTFFFAVLFLPMTLTAADRLSFGGYYKNFSLFLHLPSGSSTAGLQQQDFGAVYNRLRLQADFSFHQNLSFHAAYQPVIRIQDPLLFDNSIFFNEIESGAYRVDDLQSRLYPAGKKQQNSFGISQNLDRLFMQWRLAFADVYLGRQAVAWGSARVINPTDVIAPYAFDELDQEERRGVDALRVRIPLGMLSELDFGYLPGSDFQWRNSAVFIRSRFYVKQNDVAFLAMEFRENLLIGLDLARSIGGAGSWLETAYVFPETFTGSANRPDGYLRLSIGADYSFTGEIYGFMEYHYNGAGENRPEYYLKNFSKTAYRQGAVYLLGSHYLMPGISYQATPLLGTFLQAIWNVPDGSFYFAPSVEYNIAENIYLAGGAFIGLGTAPAGRQLKSEFGSYPDTIYSSFRVYF